jgi:hypothetical protein
MMAFLVAASAVMAPLGGAGGAGTPARPWEQPGWQDFRAAWEVVRSAGNEAALDKVTERLPALEDGMASLLAPTLARQLAEALEARVEGRRAAVHPRRGKPPRPDWPARLRAGMANLGREHAALEGLRRLGWKDPWIEGVLAPDVAFLAAGVSVEADVVEREEEGEKKLVQEARALLDRVRPTLPPLPG